MFKAFKKAYKSSEGGENSVNGGENSVNGEERRERTAEIWNNFEEKKEEGAKTWTRRVELPVFEGMDTQGWISRAEKIF